MAFFPNTADPAPIILHHTPSDTASPALLYPGETAVCHGPTHTKFWIGDGTTNRLFLSTNPADNPLLNQAALGGPFLPLTGGTLTGPGNLTLDGGTLTVSGATPTVTWDKTGARPAQWTLRIGNVGWPGDGTRWGVDDDGTWPFDVIRLDGPPVRYEANVRGNLRVTGFLIVDNYLQAIGYIATAHCSAIHVGCESLQANADTDSPTSAASISFKKKGVTRDHEIGDNLGILSWISRDLTGGEALVASIRAVATETHTTPTNNRGTELQFWTAPNAAITGGHARHAMTLGQDGNLSLPHAIPTVASDVVTLGYLTGASTGFLPLSGGTLSGPGNLTIAKGGALIFPDTLAGDDYTYRISTVYDGYLKFETSKSVGRGFNLRSDGSAAFNLRLDCLGGVNISSGGLGVVGGANISGSLNVANGWFTLQGSVPELVRITQSTPVTAAGQNFAEIWVEGIPGIDNTPDIVGTTIRHGRAITGAGIRFSSTRQWERDTTIDYGVDPPVVTNQVNQLGAEIAFFVSRNGGPSTYRAMTLEQDGNLTVVGTVTASGSLLTSDPDLKDDIAQAPSGALAKVCELPVIDFNWKRGFDTKRHRGFSATDVARVMGADSGCSADGAYSLADMNAMLWQAVQELSTQVQELRSRIDGTKHNRSH